MSWDLIGPGTLLRLRLSMRTKSSVHGFIKGKTWINNKMASITYLEQNFINETQVRKLSQDFLGVLPRLEGPCITNSRSYDKKLCGLTKGLLIHENKTYWDAVTPDGNHVENKKCKGSMWFNLGRYAQIYLKLDEDSKIETFTVIYKYTGAKVTEILLIETHNLTERLLKDYTVDDTVKAFYDMYKKCKLPRHDQAQLSYKQMEELASSKIYFEKARVKKTRPPNQMTQYLVHGQRLRVQGGENYGTYDEVLGAIVFGGNAYGSPSGFAKAIIGVSVSGWTSVSAEVRDGKWVKLDEIRKKFCELA